VTKPPPTKRPWFPVARGLKDHFGYLNEARLKVFLVILEHTNLAPTWIGWTYDQIAEEAGICRTHAHRVVHQLADRRTVKGGGRRAPYITVEPGMGTRPNRLTVHKWIRGVTSGNGRYLEGSDSHLEGTTPQIVEKEDGLADQEVPSDPLAMRTTTPLKCERLCPLAMRTTLRAKFKAFQRLSRIPLDSEDSEDIRGGKFDPHGSSEEGTTAGPNARRSPFLPDHERSDETEDGELSPADVATILEQLRAAIPKQRR
jgi:hypothetical protein